jgi:hypothetical protein
VWWVDSFVGVNGEGRVWGGGFGLGRTSRFSGVFAAQGGLGVEMCRAAQSCCNVVDVEQLDDRDLYSTM